MALETRTQEYRAFRAWGAEDAADLATCLALGTSAGDFAHKSTTAFALPSREDPLATTANAVEVIFAGTDADNETFSFGIYGYASTNGPAELICTGTGIVGTMDVVLDPATGTAVTAWYADTLVPTSYHPTAVTVADSGNNRIAKLFFDTIGYKYLKCYVYAADGTTGVEAASVAAWIRWY